jgi:hypothetical protein
MQSAEPLECFIVMPFGTKPVPDDPKRTYDFEKVYRVLIQRAVREAGMIPVRADERVSSALIHTDMFRDLRDRSVVLADLSLDNPNVFYELGVRHVMSSRGTVLMCRKGSSLPFDVKLSRVIFYDFDGISLDWEEVENTVKRLVLALQEAQKGLPDSPVHALLESVLQKEEFPAEHSTQLRSEDSADGEPLSDFQDTVAQWWGSEHQSAEVLFEKQRGTVFGSRAIGYFCLKTDPISRTANHVANHLNDIQQYRLANQLYKKLYAAKELTRGSHLAYASSYSEAQPNIAGADSAIKFVEETLEKDQLEYSKSPDSPDAILAFAECYRRLAGLCQWRWQLSHEGADLDLALTAFANATRYNSRAREQGGLRHPGFLAQARMKELLLLRVRDQRIDRPDLEGHHDAILALRGQHQDDPVGLSYLHWFQAITLADLGATEKANQRALKARVYDAGLKKDKEYWEVGGRQYTQLRRFLEQYSPYLHNPSLIGRISQILQTGDQGE